MEFYEAVKMRRTIRDFVDTQIPQDVIERIISAGMAAPTNDHMRDWHFIVITDKSVAAQCIAHIPVKFSDEEVSGILHDWNLTDTCQQNAYKDAIPKQYRMLLEASCMVIPVFKQKTDLMHPDNLSHLNGFASIWCCIENMFLAATAEHYACTLRIPLGDEAEWVQKTLGFPKEYCMPCFIAIGKPQKNAVYVAQKKYSLQERIHLNEW